MRDNLNCSDAFNDFRGAMAAAWRYAPRLQFMAMQGEAVVAYGGRFQSHRLRADNDPILTIPRWAVPSLIPEDKEP